MLIRVKYLDDHFDMIRPDTLDYLLTDGSIKSFLRHDGWVVPGLDRLRNTGMGSYTGPERRMRRGIERRASK